MNLFHHPLPFFLSPWLLPCGLEPPRSLSHARLPWLVTGMLSFITEVYSFMRLVPNQILRHTTPQITAIIEFDAC